MCAYFVNFFFSHPRIHRVLSLRDCGPRGVPVRQPPREVTLEVFTPHDGLHRSTELLVQRPWNLVDMLHQHRWRQNTLKVIIYKQLH